MPRPKKRASSFPFVYVIWWDAQSSSEWLSLDDVLLEERAFCETGGFLVKKTKREIVVTQTNTYNRRSIGMANQFTIPMGCVESIKYIKV